MDKNSPPKNEDEKGAIGKAKSVGCIDFRADMRKGKRGGEATVDRLQGRQQRRCFDGTNSNSSSTSNSSNINSNSSSNSSNINNSNSSSSNSNVNSSSGSSEVVVVVVVVVVRVVVRVVVGVRIHQNSIPNRHKLSALYGEPYSKPLRMLLPIKHSNTNELFPYFERL
ncbi:hypothetical protein V1477_006747 [Vespula maculifrons]|uniref:Uncharacterized protein n=1 Tax=Vespula maculifrons TaxID=7453 RepID=A0ABD2CHB1_VESMC